MKIKTIRAVAVDLEAHPVTKPRVAKLPGNPQFVNPMRRYPRFDRSTWWPFSSWKRVGCVVIGQDGSWGFGMTIYSGPVLSLINDHLGPLLCGQDCMATEKLWDVMQRSTTFFGTDGLASYAISAIDNALWDLKGKILSMPVYKLLGGPQKDRIFTYGSAVDCSYDVEHSIDWYLELGFRAVKVFLAHGPEEGLDGLHKNEELVARVRDKVGESVELAVDCWMSLDVEYAVRLTEALRPYRIKWLEDPFLAEDLSGIVELRRRVPYQTLATGEHWYSMQRFAQSCASGDVDVLQPDPQWAGGLTGVAKVCHMAQAHGRSVICHAGMNYPFGQHLSFAMPAVPWGERSEGVAPPGVPLSEMVVLPGTPVVQGGYVVPSDAPGFGFEFDLEWLESRR